MQTSFNPRPEHEDEASAYLQTHLIWCLMSCASTGPTVPYFNSTLLSNYTLTGKQEFLQQIITSLGDCSKRKAVCWGTSWSRSITHTFPDMRPGSSLFQPLGTSFPFTPWSTQQSTGRGTISARLQYINSRGWNFCPSPTFLALSSC